MIRLFFNCGLLRSKYLYFNLVSSKAVVLSDISNGKSIELFNISISFTSISISPVGMFLFLFSLSFTIPTVRITASFFSSIALL